MKSVREDFFYRVEWTDADGKPVKPLRLDDNFFDEDDAVFVYKTKLAYPDGTVKDGLMAFHFYDEVIWIQVLDEQMKTTWCELADCQKHWRNYADEYEKQLRLFKRARYAQDDYNWRNRRAGQKIRVPQMRTRRIKKAKGALPELPDRMRARAKEQAYQPLAVGLAVGKERET